MIPGGARRPRTLHWPRLLVATRGGGGVRVDVCRESECFTWNTLSWGLQEGAAAIPQDSLVVSRKVHPFHVKRDPSAGQSAVDESQL